MENQYTNSYSVRKIPVLKKDNTTETSADEKIDNIKIIELSSVIDRWEQEVLFADGGFYSLKGKEPNEKIKEYIQELQKFIEAEINKIKFENSASKDTANNIKEAKIKAVKQQLEIYARSELNNWELDTCENALQMSIAKAVLYKKNPVLIQTAFKNGIKILEVLADKENWNKKLFGYKKKQFASDFYSAVVKELIKNKDIEAYHYFEQYKDEINTADKEKIEKQVNEMRVNITAVNWAKEIFSYKPDNAAYEKELNLIEDEDIRKAAEKYYAGLKKSEKHNNELNEKKKNEENWKEVTAAAEKDIDTAVLCIDYSLKPESIRRKQNYISQIRELRAVKTDKNEFLRLFKEAFSDFQAFKDKDISDYQGCLSKEDYEIFVKLQDCSFDDFQKFDFDYRYALKLFENSDMKKDEEKYGLIKMYFISLAEYKEINKKQPDLEARKKIIENLSNGKLKMEN